MFKKLIQLIMINRINAAMYHRDYENIRFLCMVITNFKWFSPFAPLACKYISGLINRHVTLSQYIRVTMEEYGYPTHDVFKYLSMPWAERRRIHVCFWELTKRHIESGKSGPVLFNPQDIGIYKSAILEKQNV